MICIWNAALLAAQRPPVIDLFPAILFLVGCGLFWEVVTPLYLPHSVGDPWDIASVLLGGMGMLFLYRRFEKERP